MQEPDDPLVRKPLLHVQSPSSGGWSPSRRATRDRGDVVAKSLLARLNSVLVLNWRQKSAARSTLKLAIEDTLDTLPQAYDRQLFAKKCSAVFEHVYESYPERHASVYRAGGSPRFP